MVLLAVNGGVPSFYWLAIYSVETYILGEYVICLQIFKWRKLAIDFHKNTIIEIRLEHSLNFEEQNRVRDYIYFRYLSFYGRERNRVGKVFATKTSRAYKKITNRKTGKACHTFRDWSLLIDMVQYFWRSSCVCYPINSAEWRSVDFYFPAFYFLMKALWI